MLFARRLVADILRRKLRMYNELGGGSGRRKGIARAVAMFARD
jgi:hypothetical protein